MEEDTAAFVSLSHLFSFFFWYLWVAAEGDVAVRVYPFTWRQKQSHNRRGELETGEW